MHNGIMDSEHMAMCKRHTGVKMLLLGILILVNIFLLGLSWPVFIGAVLVLGGIGMLIMPCCSGKGHKRRR